MTHREIYLRYLGFKRIKTAVLAFEKRIGIESVAPIALWVHSELLTEADDLAHIVNAEVITELCKEFDLYRTATKSGIEMTGYLMPVSRRKIVTIGRAMNACISIRRRIQELSGAKPKDGLQKRKRML